MFAMLEGDKSRTEKANTVKLVVPEPQSKGAQVHELANQQLFVARKNLAFRWLENYVENIS